MKERTVERARIMVKNRKDKDRHRLRSQVLDVHAGIPLGIGRHNKLLNNERKGNVLEAKTFLCRRHLGRTS